MKFVHIADMHFDCPFTSLNQRENLGDLRRLEQREVFRKMITYIKENQIPYLFIAGDLYEHEYIRQSTVEYINLLFAQIPHTKIYITPGNHDPYLKNSYYDIFDWNENVHIFHSKIERVLVDDQIDIYGYGFDDFYCKDSEIEKIQIEDPNKVNILITHGSLDSGNTEDKEYNPLISTKLKQLGFDYIALGHIHKNNVIADNRMIYPGSLISLGFDELGKHGMVVGEITKEKLELELIPMDHREFVEKAVNVSSSYSQEDLIETLNGLSLEENKLYKIIFVGKRQFEIDLYQIYPLLLRKEIIKIKDKTSKRIDLEKLSREENLKGIFIKELLEKGKQEKLDEEMIERAIEIGLDALER